MRIILVGPAAAGKDYIRNLFVKRGFISDVSYTSRPPRENEKEGVDYHFIPKSQFSRMIVNYDFYEWVSFNDNFYGTSIKSWNTSNVFIMETDGISKIAPEDRKECFIMYVNTPYRIRLGRLKERGWSNAKIAKRIKEDAINFQNFKDYDLEISSN